MKYLIILLALLQTATTFSYAQSFKEEIDLFREKYKQEHLDDPRSPIKQNNIAELKFYDANESYRVSANLTRTVDAKPFDLATMNGSVKKYIQYGTATFTLLGNNYSLNIYQSEALLNKEEYKDYLFLPFTDQTNGDETYGGGRYLDIRISDIVDGKLIIDFNKAYNPYCAYGTGFSCPKPPKENDLAVLMKVGEKKFREH